MKPTEPQTTKPGRLTFRFGSLLAAAVLLALGACTHHHYYHGGGPHLAKWRGKGRKGMRRGPCKGPCMGKGKGMRGGPCKGPCMGKGRGPCMGRGRGPCMGRGRGPCMGRGRGPCMGRGRGPCMGRGWHGKGWHGMGWHGKGRMRGNYGPKWLRMVAKAPVEHLKKVLGLSAAQVQKVKQLREQHHKRMADLRLQKKRAKVALLAEWLKDRPNPTRLRTLMKAIFAAKQKTMSTRFEHHLALSQVLTPAQWKKLISKRRHHQPPCKDCVY